MHFITFYSMNNCYYCKKAYELLKNEIKNGYIVVKTAKDAPDNFNAFPAFSYNQKISIGLPKSFESLCSKLEYSPKKYIGIL